jgi:hypothetical protein
VPVGASMPSYSWLYQFLSRQLKDVKLVLKKVDAKPERENLRTPAVFWISAKMCKNAAVAPFPLLPNLLLPFSFIFLLG